MAREIATRRMAKKNLTKASKFFKIEALAPTTIDVRKRHYF